MLQYSVSFIDGLIGCLIWLKRKRSELNTSLYVMNAVPRLLSLLQGKADGTAIVPAAVRCGLAQTLTFWRD